MKYDFVVHKSPSQIYLVFICSLFFHIVFFLFFIILLSHTKPQNFEKQNIVYMQISAAPHSVANPQKEEKKIELPKKPIVKKLVQEKSLSPAVVAQKEPKEVKPLNEPTKTSAQADNNDINSTPVAEATVDTAARCKTPEIPITQDAANAGVSSGKVVLEVEIAADGKVTNAKILKGTGFLIDAEVIKFANQMQCTPAEKANKKVAVVKRLQWVIKN